MNGNTEIQRAIQNNDEPSLQSTLKRIAEQATTGTAISPSPEGWVRALPHLHGVACEWCMDDMLFDSYLWWEDGDYYATNLGPGLEHREHVPLDRFGAAALLEGTLHKPVTIEEVPRDE